MAILDFNAASFTPNSDPLFYMNNLDFNNPDPVAFIAYLEAVYQYRNEQYPYSDVITVDQYYSDDAYDALIEIWKRCKPYPEVTIEYFCQSIFNALAPSQCTRFSRLQDWVDSTNLALDVWLNKTNPAPNKTSQQKQSRSQLKALKLEDGSEANKLANAIKDAYSEYMQACAERKEAMAKWDSYVHSKKEAHAKLKAQFKQLL